MKTDKISIPGPMRAAIDRLSLPQALLLQGILLDHSMKLIGLTIATKPESAIIKPDPSDVNN